MLFDKNKRNDKNHSSESAPKVTIGGGYGSQCSAENAPQNSLQSNSTGRRASGGYRESCSGRWNIIIVRVIQTKF